MHVRTRWALILQWAAVAGVLTVVLWVPLAALAGAIGSPIGVVAGSVGAMFAYAFYAPVLAPLIFFASTPAYIVILSCWTLACRRHPAIDANWASILACAGIAALGPSAVTAMLFARGPLGVDLDDLFVWFCCSLVIFWAAMVLPRWMLGSIPPGVFAVTSSEGMAA